MTGRPILVTGSIRSGTTWVGRMIAESSSVGYIWEPLNFDWGLRNPGVCNAPIRHSYPYISAENGGLFEEAIRNTLEFRYNLWQGLTRSQSPPDVRRLIYEYASCQSHRFRRARPLVKDPYALFSAEWFSETFNMEMVVMIRHPAAVASSLKRLNWAIPFAHLLKQPLLIRDHLYPFEAEIREFAQTRGNLVEQAILLWRLVYSVVARYRRRHSDWIFLRHEDISRDPLAQLRKLFGRLQLEFTPRVASYVKDHSAPRNPSDVPVQKAFSLKRDSKSAIWNWQHRLEKSEIDRIRDGTQDIAGEFYSDEDW